MFNFRQNRRRQKGQSKGYCAHLFGLSLLLATPCWAGELPAPLTDADFLQFDMKQAALGHDLFYDKILSGNRNISCATCHHPDFGTGDGLSLGIGEGGHGLGPKRNAGTGDNRIKKRIPRNAPPLWNLGAKDLRILFHDGRLSISDEFGNGFNSPAEEWLPQGLDSLLAAQAIFPLVAQFEMAGNPGENQVAGAAHDRIDAPWPIIAKATRTKGDYGNRFVEAFAHIKDPEQVTIVEVANALAAFMAIEWKSIDSPFDQYLAGNNDALSANQKRGMNLFYGKANCSTCHSGPLMSDQQFHALGLPPFGPGRTRRFDPMVRDVGRMGESDQIEDAYRFRTPMLRNVALTAPYGHNGAYPTLEEIVQHHLNPIKSFDEWQFSDANLPDAKWLSKIDFIVQSDRFEMARYAAKLDIQPLDATDQEVADIVAFLHALTGTTLDDPTFGVPANFEP